MYQLKPITDEQLNSLNELVINAAPPIGDHLEKIKSAPGIGNNTSGRFDNTLLTLVPLGTTNNIKLLDWLEEYTEIESKYITNLHLNYMNKGAYFKPHYDNYHIDVSETFTFLLKEPEAGGKFILDGRSMRIDKNNAVIFNCGKYLHGVTKIKKGTRKSLIVFYYIPSEKKSRDII